MTGINNISQINMKSRKSCRVCGSRNLYKFLSLGPTPLANNYLEESQLNDSEDFYPLDVYFCINCYLIQLLDVVFPEVLFKNYAYLTGASDPMRIHFTKFANDVINKFKLVENSLIIDIGSNDGTLLRNFSNFGFKKILGIEPASNVAKLAETGGIPTMTDFFNEECAFKIHKEYGSAQIIIGTNVFAHNDDLESFARGVAHLLSTEGVFIIEVPYLPNLLNRLEFDTIYHEHLSYFALYPLIYLFNRFNMKITDVEEIPVHGGSIRVFVQKTPKQQSQNVTRLLLKEKRAGLNLFETYIKFAKKVSFLRGKLVRLLKSLKKENVKIVGYGATAKSCTLLNYCKIGSNILDYIIDTTPLKQGRYTSGMHIPIISEKKFHEELPDYTLLLAWNYADQIIKKESEYRQKGGKFILPIPEPKIL